MISSSAYFKKEMFPLFSCSATATHLYRIIQEGLRNIANHGQAERVRILIVKEDRRGLLLIQDDGIGFEVAAMQAKAKANRRLGLRSMEGRARMIQGKMEVISAPSEGTKLQNLFPLSRLPPIWAASGAASLPFQAPGLPIKTKGRTTLLSLGFFPRCSRVFP